MSGRTWGSPYLSGTRGAAASTHWLATSTAMAVLDQGGNAFDAAVAAGMVLQVVEPHFNGAGGEVSIVFYSAASQSIQVICGQGPMPEGATVSHFRDLGLRQIPGCGLLPACVPGAFGAWMRLLSEFGTRRVADVLQAAISYAAAGFPLLPEAARIIGGIEPLFRTEWTQSGRIYLPGGQVPRPGARFRNPLLAATFERIVAEAQAGGGDREAEIERAITAFYSGFVADAIDAFTSKAEVLDATGQRHKGLVSGSDLAKWRPQLESPVTLELGDYLVAKASTWSQGPVLLQQLALLSGFDLPTMRPDSADYIHAVTECAKLAFADREAWYGDPDHVDVPLKQLLSEEYAAQRRALVTGTAADALVPGAIGSRTSWIPEPEPDMYPPGSADWLVQIHRGLPTVLLESAARADTCPVVVADQYGNLVAAVPSGGYLKGSPAVPGLGFQLGTRGQSMWICDGHPNSVAPGKRPRTTLSPTITLRDGSPYLAFGTPGGDRQDQWPLLFFLSVTQFGMDIQAAVEELSFHSDQVPSSFTPRDSRPNVLVMESQCDPGTVAELRRRGHIVDLVPEYSLGKVCAVAVDRDRDVLRATASPRGRQAYAACL